MISKRELTSVAAACSYYNDGDHREHATDAPLEWHGHGAERAGLSGGVEREDLIRVLCGSLRNPESGEEQRLCRYVKEWRDRRDDDGDPLLDAAGRPVQEYVTVPEHRPGFDLTFSPPKSFSEACLVGGDERLREAHIQSVADAIAKFERECAVARFAEDRKTVSERTGNLLCAWTHHETNRKNEPQLHTHVLVANATYVERKEKWFSLSERSIYRARRSADTYYKSRLAERAQELGYEITKGKNGPELAGLGEKERAVFSRRHEQIERHYARHAPTARTEKVQMLARQQSVLDTRDAKTSKDRGELRDRWRATAERHGVDVDRVVQRARDRSAGREVEPQRDVTRMR